MNHEHRIVRLERALDGDRNAGMSGLGDNINALRAEISTVRSKVDSLLAKLSLLAILAAVIFPVIARMIEKKLGF